MMSVAHNLGLEIELGDGEQPYVPVSRKPERLYVHIGGSAKTLSTSKPKRK